MKRKLSTAGKVRRMIDQGHTNKAIIEKLGIKPQAVYNIRYQINKARGLGAIGTPTPVPVEGIGAPPKKRTRKVRQRELASVLLPTMCPSSNQPSRTSQCRASGLTAPQSKPKAHLCTRSP